VRTSLRKALVAVGTTTALIAPLSPATAFGASGADDLPASRNSANLQLVAHLPSTGGTDIEFFSRELTRYKDRDGSFVEAGEPVERHFAFVGNQSTGAQFIDITSPEEPYEVARLSGCRIGQGDPQVNKEGTLGLIARQGSGSCTLADGRTVGNGTVVVDLTDPYNPSPVGHAPDSAGSHNNTLHPAGRYLYISTSTLTPNSGNVYTRVPIYDLADPAAPKLVRNFTVPGNGPHDIRFSHDGKRAYFAGVSAFWIVNTEDPTNPSIISAITPPGGSIGHDTLITRDKRFLFLGDEAGGGGTYPCPGGAIYAYDLLDERAPVFLGMAFAGGGPVTARHVDEVPGPTTTGGCTSHVMELNPDGKSLTLGWYRLGTRVFDFSSFYNADGTPKTAAGIAAAWGRFGVGLVETGYMVPANANTWSAKQYAKVPGYIFSDDLNLGFYVTKIKG
jgi:hypothetical protein